MKSLLTCMILLALLLMGAAVLTRGSKLETRIAPAISALLKPTEVQATDTPAPAKVPAPPPGKLSPEELRALQTEKLAQLEERLRQQSKRELDEASLKLKQAKSALETAKHSSNYQTKSERKVDKSYMLNGQWYSKIVTLDAQYDTKAQAAAIKSCEEKLRMAEAVYEAKRRRYALVEK